MGRPSGCTPAGVGSERAVCAGTSITSTFTIDIGNQAPDKFERITAPRALSYHSLEKIDGELSSASICNMKLAMAKGFSAGGSLVCFGSIVCLDVTQEQEFMITSSITLVKYHMT